MIKTFYDQKKVLLIDEENQLRQVMAFLISRSKRFELVGIREGYDNAFTSIRNNAPSIIIMEIALEDTSGIPFLKKVKELKTPIQVIIVSDVDDENIIIEAFRAGADGYILKSDGVENILDALEHTLSNQNPLSPRIIKRIISSFRVNTDSPLSNRELQVMRLISEGMTSVGIASELNISTDTSRTHMKNIYKKLNVSSKSEAVRKALSNRFI